MRRRLDRIRFRGQKRDDFVDLAESPNTSDTECTEEIVIKSQPSLRYLEDLRDVDGAEQSDSQSGQGSLSAALQDDRSDLVEIKGHLEIALLEKHFLQKPRDTLYDSLWKWLYDHFGSYIEDFRFQPEEQTVETEEPLSAKRWEENHQSGQKKRGFRPVTNFTRNLSALSSWYSVYTSAIAFIVYMYAAWNGWTIPVFLFLALLRLSLNYLIARGWRIQWSIVPEVSEPVEPPKEELTVSEKFQLVLDVAQKAQRLSYPLTEPVWEAGKHPGENQEVSLSARTHTRSSSLAVMPADLRLFVWSLFMWVQPELTQKLYVGLWVAFISSCLLPYKLLGFIIGVYAGIKFFIIDFIFKRSAKLRQRYDTPYVIWTNLPTDLQLKERSNTTAIRRLSECEQLAAAGGRGSVGTTAPLAGRDEDSGRSYSTKRGAFHEVFNLPENERPLAVCENGWRCCLINRDRRTPTDYIRNGVLYVTESHLCFESSNSKRNKVIRLADITDIQKYKVLSVLPGSGMGISIATPSTQKPMVFGAMMHRDEAFDAIYAQYLQISATATTI
ncbi:unnamed protein product, partial [Tetraodon nigroviridis]